MRTQVTYDFGDRVAVVTGGARGIGLAVAERLLAGGARVALWDIDAHALADALRPLAATRGDRVMGMPCDLRSTESVQTAARATQHRLGPVSLLVNNAALVLPGQPFTDVSDADWLRLYDVNVVGAHRCCQALVPAMVNAGYGRVVNMASVTGKNGSEGLSAYSATKAALINYTKVSARELADTGVLVNCVAPGATETEGFAVVSDAQRRAIIGQVPLKRLAQPAEIAALVVWLCSDECSFSTGATFDATGGRSYY